VGKTRENGLNFPQRLLLLPNIALLGGDKIGKPLLEQSFFDGIYVRVRSISRSKAGLNGITG